MKGPTENIYITDQNQWSYKNDKNTVYNGSIKKAETRKADVRLGRTAKDQMLN